MLPEMAFIDSVASMCLALETKPELLAKITPAGDMYLGVSGLHDGYRRSTQEGPMPERAPPHLRLKKQHLYASERLRLLSF